MFDRLCCNLVEIANNLVEYCLLELIMNLDYESLQIAFALLN